MPTRDLYERLSMLGYPLFEPNPIQDANATLAEVGESEDIRLWEGFPIILANSIEKRWFNYEEVEKSSKSQGVSTRFHLLILLSLALYEVLKIDTPQINEFRGSYAPKEKKEFKKFVQELRNNEEIMISGKRISSERIKNSFQRYFFEKQVKISDILSDRDQFDLQHALSKIFPLGQKSLIMKKLRGEKLTKIESEYFSRVVKKKLMALANPELHKLANKLLS